MIKKYIIRVISMVCLIFTFFVIFNFSSNDGETSSELSRSIATKVITIYDLNNKLSKEKIQEKVLRIEPVIRKLAHLSIYIVIGICLMTFLYTYKIKFMKRLILGGLIGIMYAISDEIHQVFTPGRGPSIIDVYIDSIGVMLGIFLVSLIINIYKQIKDKR